MRKAFVFLGVFILLTACSIIGFRSQTEPPVLEKKSILHCESWRHSL